MFVELHLIQNFAPSNLNRDDTGAPKDCEFGGFRRARISSQCLKRSIRRDGAFQELLEETGGVRTRRLVVEVAARVAQGSPPPDDTVKVVADIFRAGGIERAAAGKDTKEQEAEHTKLILFLSKPSIDELAGSIRARLDTLRGGTKAAKDETLRELGQILVRSARAPDIALFGRMVEVKATTPFGKLQLGLDGACQVAHAMSTHRVSMEFDYYTAVDDLNPEDTEGAGMIGTVEFNSACYYRYANVDVNQLRTNLGDDRDLSERTVEAFLRASIEAVPSGKQHSMAAQNLPSFVFAVVRDRGLWSLANAFVRPVRPDASGDLVENSVRALDTQWGQLTQMYGTTGIRGRWVCWPNENALSHLADARVSSVDELVTAVRKAVSETGS